MIEWGDSAETTIQKLPLNKIILQAFHGRHVGLMVDPKKDRCKR
jgi:hypothetical protein